MGKMSWAIGAYDFIRDEASEYAVKAKLIETGKSSDDYKAQRFSDEYNRSLGSEALFSIGMRWLLSLRLLGQRIAADTDGKARLAWDKDGKSLFLDHHHIKLDGVKSFMKFVLCEVERTWKPLMKRCPLLMDLNTFPLEHLVDNPADTSPRFWFGIMPQNENLLDLGAYANSVLPAFVTTMRVKVPASATWAPVLDVQALDTFLTLERIWLSKLLIFVHLSSGMPARMSELTETTLINGIGGRPRSVTLSPGGEVILDLTYHKSEWASSRLRHNTRILHPTAGRMLTFYMCTVRQMTDVLFRMRYGFDRVYLWSATPTPGAASVGKIAHAQVVRELEYLCGVSELGYVFTINQWRHFSEAVAHKYFRTYDVRRWLDEWQAQYREVDSSNDAIMGGYELEDQADDVGQRIQEGIFSTAGMSHAQTQDPWSMQSGRNDSTSWRAYGRAKEDRPGHNADTHASARLASLAWAEFFDLIPKTTNAVALIPPARNPTSALSADLKSAVGDWTKEMQDKITAALGQAASSAIPSRASSSQAQSSSGATRFPLDASLQQMLTKIHGNASAYKGLRSKAVADTLSIMAQTGTNIVCISPTGSGKGTTWKLAMAMIQGRPGRIVLMVVPYLALMAAIVHTCRELDFDVVVWDDDGDLSKLPSGTYLLLVTLNKAVSKKFLTWIQQPSASERVERVIVDEAHVLLDERCFRLCIKRFSSFTTALKDKQFTFLSATLPPSLEHDFQQLTLLPLVYRRDLTHRPNLVHEVRSYKTKKQLFNQLRLMIKLSFEDPATPSDAQVMLFGRTKVEVDEIGRELNCPVFYSTLEDELPDVDGINPRRVNLEAFMSLQHRVMAGTSGFGPGVDPPNVIWTATINPPHSMMSQEQLAGRAGRQGQVAYCYTFLPVTSVISTRPTINPSTDAEALSSYLSRQVCMRAVTSSWLDGRSAVCLELGAQPCGVCQKQLNITPYTDAAAERQLALRREGATGDRAETEVATVFANVAGSSAAPVRNQAQIMEASVRFSHLNDKYKRGRASDGSGPSGKRVRTSTEHLSDPEPPAAVRTSWPLEDSEDSVDSEDEDNTGTGPASSPIDQFPESPLLQKLLPGRTQTAEEQYRAMLIQKLRKGTMKAKTPTTRIRKLKPEPPVNEAAYRKFFDDRLEHPFGPPAVQPTASTSGSSSRAAAPNQIQYGSSLRKLASFGSTSRSSQPSEDEVDQATPALPLDVMKLTVGQENGVELLQNWTNYQAAIVSALKLTEDACPMCDLMDLPADHQPAYCKQENLDFMAQVLFRKNKQNQWGYGQACFFCNLPQDICGRRNDEKTCDLSQYKDAVRAIIMFLSLHSQQLQQAVEYARLINPSYDPGSPRAPLEIGDWRSIEYFLQRPTYRIFQAVAMVLLRFAGQIYRKQVQSNVERIDDLFVITQQAEYFTQMASRGNDPGLAAMVQDALDIVCKRPVRTAAVRADRRASGSHIHAFYKAVIKSSRAAERIKLSLHALIVGPPPATLLL
ncbi:hypothetical protein OC861_004369 [Tilletia horrida]|nr:hypothetical protein OC861_004369 [Tilletia horrida]